jgi:tetratricopeptide (TPR) repeat protein
MTILAKRIAAVMGLCACFGLSLWAAQKPAATTPGPSADASATGANQAAPDHAKSYYHFMLARRYKELAGIYSRSDYIDRAVSEYKQAIAADPSSLFLRVELAELYSLSGHADEGIQEAEAVLKQDPDYPDAHHLLSRIYYHMIETAQGDQGVPKEYLSKAIEHLEVLERVTPKDTESLMLLGHLYRVANEPAKAEQAFRKVLQTDPSSKVGLARLSASFRRATWIRGFITCWATPMSRPSILIRPSTCTRRRWRRTPTTRTCAGITPTPC